MNCWKSVHLEKEFGLSYLRAMSFIISITAFIFSYLILSIYHGSHYVKETGVFIFLAAILLLPFLHILTHILPLILLKKPVKFTFYKKNRLVPVCTYYTRTYLTKKVSILVALSPTFLVTLPLIGLSFYFVDYYVYILLIVSLHLGMSFTDFLYVRQLANAPSKALVDNGVGQFDVLLKEAE